MYSEKYENHYNRSQASGSFRLLLNLEIIYQRVSEKGGVGVIPWKFR